MNINLPLLDLILLVALVGRALVLPWGSRATVHDPISGLLALIPEAFSAITSAVAPEALAAAPEALAAGVGTVADITLPEVVATAAPEALAVGGGDILGSVAPLVAGAGLAGADLAGTAGTGLASTAGTAGTVGPSFAPTQPLSSIPSAPSVTATTPGTPTPTSIGGAPAAAPAASAPPPAITAADAGAAGTGAPLPSGEQLADTGGVLPATGPAPGATNVDVNTGDAFGGGGFGGGTGGDVGGGSSSILSRLLPSGVSNFLSENKDLTTIAGAGLPLAAMLFQNNNIPGLAGLQSTASNNANIASALESAQTTGVLPAGDITALEQAQQAAAGGIRSNYATLGLSGSSSEAEDIAAANARITGQIPALLSQLTAQGLQASQLAGGEQQAAANLQLQQDQEFQKALQSLATNLVLASMPARTTTTTTTP